MNDEFLLEYSGVCPICASGTVFRADNAWLRNHLVCVECQSLPRERALALVLEELRPDWRTLAIHESSPLARGISAKLAREAQNLIATHLFPDAEPGEIRHGYRNEDLQKLTFDDEQFDLFISLDVFEHIPEPEAAIREIWRTLRPGGAMLCTWPVKKDQTAAMIYRARQQADGSFQHLKEPVYHGNAVSREVGSLVTVDYGYDVHRLIADTAPFDVRVYRFADRTHGLLGEFLEVFYCKKSAVQLVRKKQQGSATDADST